MMMTTMVHWQCERTYDDTEYVIAEIRRLSFDSILRAAAVVVIAHLISVMARYGVGVCLFIARCNLNIYI